jgi:hypothetical protein
MLNVATALQAPAVRRSLCAFGLFFACMSPAGWVQAGTLGGIAGTVTDAATGNPISGARLQISSPSQAVTATTDARGHFVAFSLQPDDYTITVEKTGYDTHSGSGYAVSADQTQQYDISLTPSASPAPPQPR